MSSHLIDGEFQSDKYPTCPRGKVPLSVKDESAQDLLWAYAQRRRSVDAEFSDDLETALRAAGYRPPASRIRAAPPAADDVVSARIAHLRAIAVDHRMLCSEAHLDREVARIDMIGGGPSLQIAYLERLRGTDPEIGHVIDPVLVSAPSLVARRIREIEAMDADVPAPEAINREILRIAQLPRDRLLLEVVRCAANWMMEHGTDLDDGSGAVEAAYLAALIPSPPGGAR